MSDDTNSTSEHDYTVCDGLCVPHECVCPSAAQRTAEIREAVARRDAEIIGIIEAVRDDLYDTEGGTGTAWVGACACLAEIRKGDA